MNLLCSLNVLSLPCLHAAIRDIIALIPFSPMRSNIIMAEVAQILQLFAISSGQTREESEWSV